MARYLFLIFLAIPLIEIAIFIAFGQVFGLLPTLVGVVVTALIGSFIIRKQGMALFEEIRQTTQSGALPAKQLAEAMMVGIAGAFLLTPGYFTDALGFLLLVPQLRTIIYNYLKSKITIAGQSYQSQTFYEDGSNSASKKQEDDNLIDLDEKDWRK